MGLLVAFLMVMGQVNLPLTPAAQFGNAGTFVTVDLRAEASTPQSVAAIDAILSWNPAELQLIVPAAGGYPWFLAGFLPDPDGINANVLDGTALYTALASPASPLVVPPGIVVASFTFKVLTGGNVTLLPSVGTFGKTRVLGTTPGVEITGTISGPVCVGIPGTWTDLGNALAGVDGEPVFTGAGEQACSALTTLSLAHAKPNQQAFLVLGASTLNLPLKGGVLVPQLNVIVPVTTSPTGTVLLVTPWPMGIPSGASIYYQYWLKDAAADQGWAASNALKSTTG